MSRIVNDILGDVSRVLVEHVVNTSSAAPIASGSQVVTPGSMDGIYVGAKLLVGSGGTREQVTVTAITATTFTATFVNSHAAAAPIVGATFPSGRASLSGGGVEGHPLFTQDEMIAYLADVQDDYLLKVRPVYERITAAVSTGIRFYTHGTNVIRLERISIAGRPLLNVSVSDLDMIEHAWPATTTPGVPTHWFQDKLETAKYGYFPLPQVNETAALSYSVRSNVTLALNTALLVPDIFSHYVKYGVLAMAFGKDGEQRDPMRAEYCSRRFDFGVMLGQKFMEGVQARPSETELPPQALFRRFPLPPEVGRSA